jgi:hypothetical protein
MAALPLCLHLHPGIMGRGCSDGGMRRSSSPLLGVGPPSPQNSSSIVDSMYWLSSLVSFRPRESVHELLGGSSLLIGECLLGGQGSPPRQCGVSFHVSESVTTR